MESVIRLVRISPSWIVGIDESHGAEFKALLPFSCEPLAGKLDGFWVCAQVAGFLFNSAKSGNVTAQIFWLKTRARWKEPALDHKVTGAIATANLDNFSDAELVAMLEKVREWKANPPDSHR